MTLLDCLPNALLTQQGPTAFTIIAAAFYAFCTALSFAVVRRNPPGPAGVFWRIATVVLLICAINRGFDLQNMFTATARCMVQEAGWYQQRRPFQAKSIAIIGGLSFAALIVIFWLIRHDLRRHAFAIIGVLGLSGFSLIRAISLHGVDRLLGRTVYGLQISHMIEATGLGLVTLNAVWLLGRGRK